MKEENESESKKRLEEIEQSNIIIEKYSLEPHRMDLLEMLKKK